MVYSGFGLNEIVNCDKLFSVIRGHFIRILNDVIYILSMCDPKYLKDCNTLAFLKILPLQV